MGKACTAAIGRRESRLYEEMVNNGRTAFVTASAVTALESGVPGRFLVIVPEQARARWFSLRNP